MTALYDFFERLSRRAPLLVVRDGGLDAEREKLGVIRIVVGLVVIARVLPIVYGGYFYFFDRLGGLIPASTALGMVVLCLLVLATIGLFTPLALVALLLVYGRFDAMSQAVTLGSGVLTMLLLLLLLAGAGSRRSLDAALMRRQGWLGRVVEKLYAFPGPLSESTLRVVYFLLFTSFALVSFGAVLLHASDSYWREGYTLQVLFTSSYLSRAYPFFRELEAAAPGVLRWFSIVGSGAQAAFQLLMLPLIFTRIGGWFVALWGLNFFLMSALFLELSYLPYLELLLWTAVFVRAPSRKPVEIFYDDLCNLCKGSVRTLRLVDAFGAFVFRPASLTAAAAAAHGISPEALYSSLHGVFGKRVYAGYDLYLLIALRCPLLWPVAPLLWVGRAVRAGPWIYALVARNRRRLFGTCKVPYDVNRGASAPGARTVAPARAFGAVCAVFVMLYAGTLLLQVPYFEWQSRARLHGKTRLPMRLGFGVPDVFNSTDLRLSDQWPVIYRDSAGSWTLVPMHDVDGRKLLYPRLVDILYFGNSLRWRRLALEGDLVEFNQPGGKGYELVQRAIAFDDRLRGRPGGRYRVEIYRKNGSDPRRIDREKYRPELVYAYEVSRPKR